MWITHVKWENPIALHCTIEAISDILSGIYGKDGHLEKGKTKKEARILNPHGNTQRSKDAEAAKSEKPGTTRRISVCLQKYTGLRFRSDGTRDHSEREARSVCGLKQTTLQSADLDLSSQKNLLTAQLTAIE